MKDGTPSGHKVATFATLADYRRLVLSLVCSTKYYGISPNGEKETALPSTLCTVAMQVTYADPHIYTLTAEFRFRRLSAWGAIVTSLIEEGGKFHRFTCAGCLSSASMDWTSLYVRPKNLLALAICGSQRCCYSPGKARCPCEPVLLDCDRDYCKRNYNLQERPIHGQSWHWQLQPRQTVSLQNSRSFFYGSQCREAVRLPCWRSTRCLTCTSTSIESNYPIWKLTVSVACARPCARFPESTR